MKSIAIIGGGAAGMMAATALKESELTSSDSRGDEIEIHLFEKNPNLGAKVIISGGGRCNVTTGITDIKKLLENYPRGAKFLRTAMYDFPPEKVMEWFEQHGVPLKIEEDLRVFPKSNNGKDIVGALEKVLQNVHIHTNANVIQITKKSDSQSQNDKQKFIISLKDGTQHETDFVIITTGGNAYRHTGSTGDGYAFAKSLGHTITQLGPSLNSFITAEEFTRDVSGVSFEKAKITFMSSHTSSDENRTFARTGPFLFTHRGVSGPAIFALSSYSAYENFSKEKPATLAINFFPDENPEQLKNRFQEMLEKNSKKHLENFLDFFLPKSLCKIFTKILEIPHDFVIANLNKEQRLAILKLLQNFTLHIVGRGAGDEFVTAGGVPLTEVNPNTMESKICPNLYFAGEILDIDGFTGGFNLQASWATGHLAGKSIAK